MRETLLESYDRVLPFLRAHGERLQADLAALLRADEGLKVHSVTLRIKSRESLAAKLARPDRSYGSLWSVTDLIGLRVIVYFEAAVDTIGKLLEAQLPIDFAHSIDKRRRDSATFGYRSLHYVCRAGAPATELPVEASFEVQVRTVLEHAWAEIEHDLGYKSGAAVPATVQRRLHRLAGLLELADQEFGAIRDDLRDYVRVLPERIASEGDSVLLDRLSLGALLDCAEVRDLDRVIAVALDKELGDEPFYPDYLLKMLASSGVRSVGEARAGVAEHGAARDRQYRVLGLGVKDGGRLVARRARRRLGDLGAWLLRAVSVDRDRRHEHDPAVGGGCAQARLDENCLVGRRPPFDRPACSHFAACDVQRACFVAKRFHLQKRSTDGQFHIVGMRENCQNI